METLARTDLNLIRVGFLILGVRCVVGGGGGGSITPPPPPPPPQNYPLAKTC